MTAHDGCSNDTLRRRPKECVINLIWGKTTRDSSSAFKSRYKNISNRFHPARDMASTLSTPSFCERNLPATPSRRKHGLSVPNPISYRLDVYLKFCVSGAIIVLSQCPRYRQLSHEASRILLQESLFVGTGSNSP